MKLQNAYYAGEDLNQLLECMENRNMANLIKKGAPFKMVWKCVSREWDIFELIYYFRGKKGEYDGCVGGMSAQDALDFIYLERDRKIHELGECYK